MEKEYIKEQIKKKIEDCENFDEVLDKISQYIIDHYEERKIEVE